jgi:hypothetical protein
MSTMDKVRAGTKMVPAFYRIVVIDICVVVGGCRLPQVSYVEETIVVGAYAGN